MKAIGERVAKLEKKVHGLEKRIEELEKKGVSRRKIEDKPLTLPEFMNGRKTQYNRHKVLRVGYYLEFYKGRDFFTTEAITEGYKKCGFTLPSNLSDILSKMYSKGLLREEGEKKGKKLWSLSGTGIRNIEEEGEDG